MEIDHVSYTKKHREIVESGLLTIQSYYYNNDLSEQRSILFCLDRYLDPYFASKLEFEEELFIWLESEIVKNTQLILKEDIYELLYRYHGNKYDHCDLSPQGVIVCDDID